MYKQVLFLIKSLAFVFVLASLQGCATVSVDDVTVNQEALEMMTEENASSLLISIIRMRHEEEGSNCRISEEGLLSGPSGDYFQINQIKFSYALIPDLKILSNIHPHANFYKKADGSEICTARILYSGGQSGWQKIYDWQEELLTTSLVALGAELVQ